MQKSRPPSRRPSASNIPLLPHQSTQVQPVPPQAASPSPQQRLLLCLQSPDASAQDVAQCLVDLRASGEHTLNFSGQRLSAAAAVKLAQALRDWSDLRDHITAVNFSNAVLEGGLAPWVEALQVPEDQRGVISAIDASGTQVLSSAWGEAPCVPLQPEDLSALAKLLKACPALRDLRLNRQPELSGQLSELSDAWGACALEHLELRGCGLVLQDLDDLDLLAEGSSGPGLQFLDLRDNDQLLNDTSGLSWGKSAGGVMASFAAQLTNSRSLQSLQLPSNAVPAFLAHEESALALMLLLDRDVCPVQLWQLEPFAPVGAELALALDWFKQRLARQLRLRNLDPLFLDQRNRVASVVNVRVCLCLLRLNGPGLANCLRLLQELGMGVTLDVRQLLLTADSAGCLATLLTEQPDLVRQTLTGFDFGYTQLEGGLARWLAVLQQHALQGGQIKSLNVARTKTAPAPKRATDNGWIELSAAECDGIAELVASCPTLSVLDLSGQPGLSGHMEALSRAIALGWVQSLTLHACDLRLSDAQSLLRAGLGRHPDRALRVIDLDYNHKLFKGATAHDVIRLVREALKNPALQALRLPGPAAELFDDASAAELTRLIKDSGHAQLSELAPFTGSGSDSERFAELRQILKANAPPPKS